MSSETEIISGKARLAATVRGNGHPVVFLHAAVADSRMWTAQCEGLSATHRAIAYDRRGFGKSEAAPEEHSSVEDLMTVIDKLGDGSPVTLVGCSQGGQIALDAALRYPARVHSLVLIAPNVSGSPAPSYPAPVASLMEEIRHAETKRDVDRVNDLKARVVLDGALSQPGRVTEPARALFLEMNGTVLRKPSPGSNTDSEDAYHRLHEIRARSLVIWGDLDFPHVQERCRKVADGIRDGSHIVLRNAAHLPSMEAPETITGLLRDFLQ
ncbi:alpha/beta fold hydrolase [Nisaea sediminum]|uniref:alpha/beta fold hydrolase n=1 Tax=Nisaea sediminum TaxID=2775867 RepID=UPI0018680462|nr:alpha/beta hydrolase [Nisaea sediminum]